MGVLREHLIADLKRRVELAQMPHVGLGVVVEDVRRAIVALYEADDEIRALREELQRQGESFRESLRIERDLRLHQTRANAELKRALAATAIVQQAMPLVFTAEVASQ